MHVLSDILHQFAPFGMVHLLAVLAISAAAVLAVRYRRRLATEERRLRFDRLLIITAMAFWIINQTSELLPWRFVLTQSLPIHLCDVVGLIAPIAILTHWRPLRALLYYWGLGLSTQALITPELQHGMGAFDFWVFWVPHGMIVVLVIYDLAVFRYRPAWKDFFIAAATLAVFVMMVIPVNLWLDVNYVYVGKSKPGQPSVIDFLGPWPLRVFKLAFGVLVLLTIMTLPWVLAGRRQRQRREAQEEQNADRAADAALTPNS